MLEDEGDIRVLSSMPRLPNSIPDRAVAVLGPEVRATLREWEVLLTGGAVVVLTAVPGWRRYPAPVRQVPMELSGDGLRRAVREAAAAGGEAGDLSGRSPRPACPGHAGLPSADPYPRVLFAASR